MKLLALLAVPALCALPIVRSTAPRQESAQDMAAMMAAAAKYTQPGEHHKELERFIGEWNWTMSMFNAGEAFGLPPGTPPMRGTATASWKMEGRWLESSWTGSVMGMPTTGFSLMGYDNFKQSFVSTSVTSMDTAMARVEGDMTPDGKSLIMYGDIDEYLTGEIGKMVKWVYRFESRDSYTVEMHDLPIGDVNTKVVELRFTRRK